MIKLSITKEDKRKAIISLIELCVGAVVIIAYFALSLNGIPFGAWSLLLLPAFMLVIFGIWGIRAYFEKKNRIKEELSVEEKKDYRY